MGGQQNGLANNDAILASLHWPVLIKYGDYEELGYVADASSWEAEVGLVGAYLNIGDILIDSSGVSFAVVEQGDNQRVLKPTQRVYGLDEVLDWVRAHASMQDHCCVAKLHASTIGDVFSILKSLDD